MACLLFSESDYQFIKLSDVFYQKYCRDTFPELLHKKNRPYNCLLFQTHYDFFICVPLRTRIKHDNAFIFKNTKRGKTNNSGLDYSKIVIIKDRRYIRSGMAIIDSDEYKETYLNIETIKGEVLKYVEEYMHHISGEKALSNSYFKKRYYYSS